MLLLKSSPPVVSFWNLKVPSCGLITVQPGVKSTALAFFSKLLTGNESWLTHLKPPNGAPAVIVPFPASVVEKPTEPSGDTKYEPAPKPPAAVSS